MDLFKDENATQSCVERNPNYRAIKITNDLIAGTDCDRMCCLLTNECETCQHNTNTPYVIINDKYVFVKKHSDYPYYPCTGFNVDEPHYMLIDEFDNSIKFISETDFNKRFKFTHGGNDVE